MPNQELAPPFTLVGHLEPKVPCEKINYSYETVKYGTKIHIKQQTVELQFQRQLTKHKEHTIRNAIANVSATLDGQFLVSGQIIQASFEHIALRRGEGEAIWTSRVPQYREVTNEHVGTGIRIGQFSELVPPLAHALRDFRIATILPREDGVVFLWRCLESILWFLGDKSTNKAAQNIKLAANQLGISPDLFKIVEKHANHSENFGRHASHKYLDRLIWLRETTHIDSPTFFTEKMFAFSEDDKPADIFPVSFSDSDWENIWRATGTVVVHFVSYLRPYGLPSVIFPPW